MRNHGRAQWQTQVSISIPEDLLKKIQALADADGRNRSNMIVHLLRQEVETSERERIAAEALIKAHRRGVSVSAILDKSQHTERYSGATFLANAGVSVSINSRYAIMHKKFLVIDGATVETGSFNFTSAAAKKNAENVLIVRGDEKLAAVYSAEWSRLWSEGEAYEPRD